jgi:hypothetical protein
MLQSIKMGAQGEATADWQYFLLGQGLYKGEVNGDFDKATDKATKAFQTLHKLSPVDGWVGRDTYAVAMQHGYDPLDYTLAPLREPALPPFSPLTSQQRDKLFGKILFKDSPTKTDKEAVTITNGWSKNITKVSIPQLVGLPGAANLKNFFFHEKVAVQVQVLFQAWEDEGLKHLLLGFGGSWVPRYIRGSRSVLSSHAWGTAFDINVQWNQRGVEPARAGTVGSVRELVATAHKHGFYWGGHFGRPDGMHFEVAKLL